MLMTITSGCDLQHPLDDRGHRGVVTRSTFPTAACPGLFAFFDDRLSRIQFSFHKFNQYLRNCLFWLAYLSELVATRLQLQKWA
jgi:hypothetical protein